jgi:hypothetical protein
MRVSRMQRVRRRLQLAWDGIFGPLPQPDKWVFIVGCNNSGTTLLKALIASHPSVGSMSGEGQFWTTELVRPLDTGFCRQWALKEDLFYLDETSGAEINVTRLKRQWGAHFDDPTRPLLVDKSTPNSLRTRWLQANFDNAHFVGIVRNGYAVAEGIRRRTGQQLERSARHWARANEILLQDFQYLRKKLLVSYESLVTQPALVCREIAKFLELDSSGFNVARSEWNIHNERSPIRDMNAESVARLSAEEKKLVEDCAGNLLRRLGYMKQSE